MDVPRLRLTTYDARQLLRAIEQYYRELGLEGIATTAASAVAPVQWNRPPEELRAAMDQAIMAARCCRPLGSARAGYAAIALVLFSMLRKEIA